jgi:hypothetical protein
MIIEKASSCEFFRLLLYCVEKSGNPKTPKVQFLRIGSSFTLETRDGPRILSTYTIPDIQGKKLFAVVKPRESLGGSCFLLGYQPLNEYIQYGFPELSEAGSPTHFKVLREWLRLCDDKHQCHPESNNFLPTRVLDVGTGKDSSPICLSCVNPNDSISGPYIALSHRWGNPKQHQQFCTTQSNLDVLKQGIKFDALPRTFQDAITVTRQLGIRFLWIDSLCIIQDDPEDWERESKRMEDVFSSAYCTIAATCSTGSGDGFLKRRGDRRHVTMRSDKGFKFFICEAIDDFGLHVEASELNQRGWVLQERALSSRTIHFTEKQSYWECGEGIRCETHTKMQKYVACVCQQTEFWPTTLYLQIFPSSKNTNFPQFKSFDSR